ncbi:hypothetical protein FGSG_07746 [Fusarium graminearum PH-1]|uniref:hypothetical protein n=1 Tax=Gibberella zeae (strain ATCC MYA-4620 / CBS 123657 / FGSC 9075 / NRRL 31084 / PH-1) TaxID=229533 RepID=UPI00021F18F0|nr:hypothetical protein FGSG_07746 [Fusarium graminearum PH-1]ESU14050.1 hypothetical protein FGSG_07746 [Fusarium graminearum PH-1]|eukprot:XP_011327557.1 hypothetical protein FGSG_07746 [Fusarium graminearum PH-1]
MASASPQCQALRGDKQRCTEEATHANQLFCLLHSRQAQGLYVGYKRRNAKLEYLEKDSPEYLAKTKTPLVNDDFSAVNDEETIQDVINHLLTKYSTLNRVIEARKQHHMRFYSISYDYGHQLYIDKLVNQRHITLGALERARKRFLAMHYENERWYSWVKHAQDEQEENREKEQKKVKQEAALFQRHMKQLEARLEIMRRKEEKRLQDAFLDEAYKERMAQNDDNADDAAWDPIEDMEEDKRNQYIDLIKHFLWMPVDLEEIPSTTHDASSDTPSVDVPSVFVPTSEPEASTSSATAMVKAKKKKAKSGSKKTSSIEDGLVGQMKLLAIAKRPRSNRESELKEPDKKNIEIEEEMRKRLREGANKNRQIMPGTQIVGTMVNPHTTWDKTAPMPEDEIDDVIRDIREIKLYLFCRLILSQASLLPAALKANNVQEFLDDNTVAESDLRDLCLRVAEPTLQDIRDASADFAHGDKPDEISVDDTDDDDDETLEDLARSDTKYSHLHTRNWFIDRAKRYVEEKKKKKKKKNKSKGSESKSKVTICEKSIWNHASQNVMSRDGWLQFSIMAKDCNLQHAIQLCRNWSEFSDLSLLAMWQYFLASNWDSWGVNTLTQQLQQFGFFPYFADYNARTIMRYHQSGNRSAVRRQHDMIEARNILVGSMKRNDPVTRRFLQYLLIRAGEVLVMVRDGKTGRVITASPKEHLWTYRKKTGLGRAARDEWENILEMGPEFMKLTDQLREWRFGFNDFYDVYIWDLKPGQDEVEIFNKVSEDLRNAWLHDDDDVEESLYMFYNEGNEAEDAVLFPDESTRKNFAFREISNDPQHDALRDQQMHTIRCLPNLWVTGSAQARKEKLDGKSRALLKKTGLMREPKKMNFDIRMETLETQEI